MDLILRNARLVGAERQTTDIGIAGGRIADIRPGLSAEAETIDLQGRLVSSGLIETHIHLDKSAILERCKADKGDLDEAIREVAKAKKAFTPEDVYQRARRTLEKCILNGTTHMRTQLEVDPGIGLRGLEGVRPLIDEYRWAIDIEICVFPQEAADMGFDLDRLGNLLVIYGINLAGAVLVALIGWWAASLAQRTARRALLASSPVDPTLASFLSSLARYAILLVTFLVILQLIGIQATSL